MKKQITALALGSALAIGLTVGAPPAANADKERIKDPRGDSKALDIRSVKLNNGKHRLVATVRLTKKSMRPRGRMLIALKYQKPRVLYSIGIRWNRHKRLGVRVVRMRLGGGRAVAITKRCDVRKVRRHGRIRVGLDQRGCFRRDAGRVRISALSMPRRGRGDMLPNNGYSKPIRRG